MQKGSLLVGQSGGPTAVINASLEGVIEEALDNLMIDGVYGCLNGIEGIINKQIIDLAKESKETISLLKHTPGSILGSVRFKLPDFKTDDTLYKQITKVFKSLNIKYFFYIGGNDSMDTCNKINEYFKLINFDCTVNGIPKTVDNDLVITDHTPGYGSSIKYIATCMAEIYQDISCYKKGKVTIVEVMGRDAGWLTAGSSLASLTNNGPDLISLPEVAFDMNKFLEKVDKIYKEKGHALVAISEGIKDKDGKYILTYKATGNTDGFGHMQLGGVSAVLAEFVNTKLGLPVRSIELNLPQRCSSHLVSKTDIEEALACGKAGVNFAINHISGQMISMKRKPSSSYEIEYTTTPLSNIANAVKCVDSKYITNEGFGISKEFIEYALPLIEGELNSQYQNGMPQFAKLKKHYVKF